MIDVSSLKISPTKNINVQLMSFFLLPFALCYFLTVGDLVKKREGEL